MSKPKRRMPEDQRRALVRMLSGLAVLVTVAAVLSDRVLLRLQSIGAATAWGFTSGVLLPVFLVFSVEVWFRQPTRFRPAIVILGALALTLSFAGLLVSLRSDSRSTHHARSAPVDRFDNAFLVGLSPLIVYVFVKARTCGRKSARHNDAPISFLITGWPNGQDHSPQEHWDCDDEFATFDLAVGAAKSWLRTEPRTAEVEVLQDDGRNLTVVAMVTYDKVVSIPNP